MTRNTRIVRGHLPCISGNTAPTALCTAGSYCTQGADNAAPTDGVMGNICPAGRYCEEGSITGTDCPAGTFSNSAGLVAVDGCEDCTPGYYCATTGLTVETGQCYAGKIMDCKT